ncbi:Tic20 family protein [Calothrix sp. UHCC 0171]|uniref:Tic20 family protein n=1 Tax=Calothrix sp. UHCC 0171 TaxID=3110245 RepID=UPI002B1FE2F6|nr:Tic20 family protein [Calothrix sp. UHCC 0171]MEA5573291.1 Tic20 family protein [Calothrix sp. UHCC 0171]
MTWRGTTTVPDRIFASLPYLLPLVEVLVFGATLFAQFPALRFLVIPLLPFIAIYGAIPFGSLVVFFALFFLVVRNEKIPHFIRYNTMQAILLDIVVVLCNYLIRLVGFVPGANFAIQTLSTTIFLGIVGCAIYSIVQSLIGKYAEIPAISDAVYTQVR